ncbi:homoserine kinase [Lacicoccus qingdaonensis]|uniref:Homoserine kinase n=1 Tax=Lacicoccus qingdaonensis TaxID=576118 RepID=A0A1G9AKH1_9BACL|nr:homoserine kinase [Salinicoccus qingdaonensis]SDK27753.1 homoserine kinase [Salinicoccus qingdaonensis]
MKQIDLRIPATSANLGLGFDSIGVAVTKFLKIRAYENAEFKVDFLNSDLDILPPGEDNLVISTAKSIARKYNKEMPPVRVEMDSEIPLAHGLGSSSSAIVAGIEIAAYFCDLNLSDHDKIMLGCDIEGHPDNIGPCITGGVFVGYYNHGELYYHVLDDIDFSLIVSVPNYMINTNEARRALPDSYSRQTAVNQNAITNVMLFSLFNKEYVDMGRLMMKDQFHEIYRRPLIKEFDEIKDGALRKDAYATVISGAGPSVMTLCAKDDVQGILRELKKIDNVEHEELEIYKK